MGIYSLGDNTNCLMMISARGILGGSMNFPPPFFREFENQYSIWGFVVGPAINSKSESSFKKNFLFFIFRYGICGK